MADLRADILDPMGRRLSAELRVALLGRVRTFARATGRAAARILSAYVTSDGVTHEWPDAQGAVVIQPRGDGYAVAFDVASGDAGLLVFGDHGWEQAALSGEPQAPPDGTRHTFAASAFLPGGRRSGDAPANPKGSMRVGAEDGSAAIDMSRTRGPSLGSITILAQGPSSSVRLGSAAASLNLAYNAQVKAALAAAINALNAAVQANPLVDPITVATKAAFAAGVAPAIAAANGILVGTLKTVAE